MSRITCDNVEELATVCAELFKCSIRFEADTTSLMVTLLGY